jgi:SSS family solute:Na+ symporter
MGVANWEWWCLPTYNLLILFFIPLYLKSRIITVPELLTRRFGPACGYIYSYVMLFGYIVVFLPPVLYGGSVTFGQLMGWSPVAVLIGIAVLVGLYTVAGGLSSVMWTDALQSLMLIVGGILLYFFALNHIPGGWHAMVEASPERYHLYKPPSDPDSPFLGLIMASFGVFLFYQATNQVMIQRVLAARSPWDGVTGILFAGGINLFRPIVTCFLGFVVYHWIEVMHMAPTLLPDNQDHAFPYALEVFAPSGLRGIVVASFLAAIMSSVSALSNAIGSIFSLDVYGRVIRPKASDKELVRIGQFSTAAALIIASCLSPMVGTVGIFKYFQTGVTYIAMPFISVILMGILWKRTTYLSGIIGLIGGVVIQIVLALANASLDPGLNWLYVGFIAQGLTMLLVFVAALLTKNAAHEDTSALVWNLKLLKFLDEPDRPWYKQLKLWIALYAVAWMSVYAWFW